MLQEIINFGFNLLLPENEEFYQSLTLDELEQIYRLYKDLDSKLTAKQRDKYGTATLTLATLFLAELNIREFGRIA